MNKANAAKFLKQTRASLSKHSPEILVGLGIGGMLTTTVLAVRATPKALKLIDQKKKEKQVDKLTPGDTIKATWKCYAPAALTCATSIACLIGASSVHVRRHAALATAYKISETALTEYREKVVETLGEKKEKLVREKVDKSRIEKNPVSKNEVIVTEKGNTLCYEAVSGRYFKSDIDLIKKAMNEFNRTLLNDMYASLNEWYDEINLDHISIGDNLGWNIDKGLVEIDFTSHIADDGTPCLVVNYNITPYYGYSSLY